MTSKEFTGLWSFDSLSFGADVEDHYIKWRNGYYSDYLSAGNSSSMEFYSVDVLDMPKHTLSRLRTAEFLSGGLKPSGTVDGKGFKLSLSAFLKICSRIGLYPADYIVQI